MSYVKSTMFFLGLGLLVLGTNANIADFIHPCPINDNVCELASAQAALPAIAAGSEADGIRSFIDMKLAKSVDASAGDMNVTLHKIIVKGLEKCKVVKMERPTKHLAKIVLVCPITITGEYKADGKLAGLPIQGDGPCQIKIESILISLDIILKEVTGKDNEIHYKIASFDYTYKLKSKVEYTLENLYNGNKDLADPLIAFINTEEGAKAMFDITAPGVIKAVVTEGCGRVDDVFVVMPANKFEAH